MASPDGGRPAGTEQPALVSLTQRIESVHRSLGELSMKLDGVADAAGALRADIADELTQALASVLAATRLHADESQARDGRTGQAIVEVGDAVEQAQSATDGLRTRIDAIAGTLARTVDDTRGLATALENLLRLVAGGFAQVEAALAEQARDTAAQVREALERAPAPPGIDHTVVLDSIAVLHDDVADQLGQLRESVGRLRRRLPVRAKDAALAAGDIKAIADAVVERVVRELEVVEEPAER
jgi:hypothetical protein